jgi:hypothetical protein
LTCHGFLWAGRSHPRGKGICMISILCSTLILSGIKKIINPLNPNSSLIYRHWLWLLMLTSGINLRISENTQILTKRFYFNYMISPAIDTTMVLMAKRFIYHIRPK